MKRFRVTMTFEYNVDMNFYPTSNVEEMIEIDLENIADIINYNLDDGNYKVKIEEVK